MSASGILQSGALIYYHALDDVVEHTLSQSWSGDAAFVSAVVSSGYAASGSLEATDPGAYPSASGAESVTTFFLTNNPTTSGATITIERGYIINLTETDIKLGGATLVWATPGVSGLMTAINDGFPHCVCLDFRHEGAGLWRLFSSVDGMSFVDEGTESGLVPISTDTSPKLTLTHPAGLDHFVDELVFWTETIQFSDVELLRLCRLGTVLGLPMPLFESIGLSANSGIDLLVTGHQVATLGTPQIYWVNEGDGTIHRSNTDGTNEVVLVSGLSLVSAVAVDPSFGKIFWADRGTDKIQKSNLDGTLIEDVATGGMINVFQIDLDKAKQQIYFTDISSNDIERVGYDGSNRTILVSSLSDPGGVGFDSVNQKIYYSDFGGVDHIGKVGLDIPAGETASTRSDREFIVSQIINGATALEADFANNHFYYIDQTDRAIKRINLDGTNPIKLVTSGMIIPQDLQLDLSSGKMYWVDQNTDRIQKSNLDGSNIETIVAGLSVVRSLVLDTINDKIYWVDDKTNRIERTDLDGNNQETMLIRSNIMNVPGKMTIDNINNKIYWAENSNAKIHRMSLELPSGETNSNRTDIEEIIGATVQDPISAAVLLDGDKVLWADSSKDIISRANKIIPSGENAENRSDIERIVTSGLLSPAQMDVDTSGGKIYWVETSLDLIRRSNFDGTQQEDIITGLSSPTGLVLDLINGKVYWGDNGTNRIERSNLDGSGGIETMVSRNVDGTFSLAIDASGEKIYWTDIVNNRIMRAPGGATASTRLDVEHVIGRPFRNTQDIVLDPNAGKLYVVDFLDDQIFRYDLSNDRNIEKFVVSGINNVQTLGIDTVNSKLYWADFTNQTIQRASLIMPSGKTAFTRTDIETVLTSADGLSAPRGVAVDTSGSKIYWGDAGTDKIRRSDLDGTGIEDLIIIGTLPSISALEIDSVNSKVYWLDDLDDKIYRSNLDGSSRETIVPENSHVPVGVEVDDVNNKLYWSDTDNDRIIRSDLDGSNQEIVVSTDMIFPSRLTVDPSGDKIYWTDQTRNLIRRANLDGSNIEDIIDSTSGVSVPIGIDVDVSGQKLYWCNFGNGRIKRSNLDGTNVEDILTSASGLNRPFGLIIDNTNQKLYWTDTVADKIRRANLDGTIVEDVVTTSVASAIEITIDEVSGIIYWVDSITDNIEFATASGTDLNRGSLVTTGTPSPQGLSIHQASGLIFWGDITNRKVERITTNATNRTDIITSEVITSAINRVRLDITNNKLYWNDNALDSVSRMNLPGSGFNSGVINSSQVEAMATGLTTPVGIAVDPIGNRLYWNDNSEFDIKSVQLNGSGFEVFTDNEQSDIIPFGIAIDSSEQKLYFTDINKDIVFRSNLEGSGIESLVVERLFDVRAIDIDSSGQKIYWADIGQKRILSADLDGTNINVLAQGSPAVDDPRGIAIDSLSGLIYWTDDDLNRINRVRTDGKHFETLLTGVSNPRAIVLGPSGKMYWVEDGTNKIRRANRDGSNPEDLVTGLSAPFGLDINAISGRIYWSDDGTNKIQHARLSDGGDIQDLITTGLISPNHIKIHNNKLYWIDLGTDLLERIDLDGSNRITILSGDDQLIAPLALSIDTVNDEIYWADLSVSTIQRHISKTDLDGSGITIILQTLQLSPVRIAIDVPQDKIYINDTTNDKIIRSSLTGSGVETFVANPPAIIDAFGLIVDPSGNKIYWSETASRTKTIKSADLNGSGIQTLYATHGVNFDGLAIADNIQKLYWVDAGQDKIFRSNLDGTNIELIINNNLSASTRCAIDASGERLYWTDQGFSAIKCSQLDGTLVSGVHLGLSIPFGITIDGNQIYWVEQGVVDKVRKSDLDGSNGQDLATGLSIPRDIFVDAVSGEVYWSELGSDKIRKVATSGGTPEDVV